jgi:hypothetical protein
VPTPVVLVLSLVALPANVAPTAVARTTAAASVPPGSTLTVQSTCYGGVVAVDRLDIGHVPAPPFGASPGFHVVEVTCPQRARQMRLVYLPPDGHITLSFADGRPTNADRSPGHAASPTPTGSNRQDAPPTSGEDASLATLIGRSALTTVFLDTHQPERLAVEHAWALRYGPPGDGRAWIAARFDARHPVEGATTTAEPSIAHLRVFEVASPRADGWRGRIGRRARHMPFTVAGHLDGGGVDFTVGSLSLDAAAGFDEGTQALGRVGLAATAGNAGVALTAEVRREETMVALVGDTPRIAGWGLDARVTAAPNTPRGAAARLSFDGAGLDAELDGQWQRTYEAVRPALLPVNGALMAAAAGGAARLAATWTPPGLRSRLSAAFGSFGATGSADALARWSSVRAGVDAEVLDGAGPLPDRRRLLMRVERAADEGIHAAVAVGPERVAWPDGATHLGPCARSSLRGPLGGPAWLVLEVAYGAVDRRVHPDAHAGTLATLGLEVR